MKCNISCRGIVSFDVGFTLLEPYPSVGAAYVEVAKRFTSDPIDPACVDLAFKREWARRSGTFDYSKASWRRLVAAVFEGIHPIGQKQEFFEELYEYFAGPRPWRLRPEAKTVLEELRSRRFRIVVTSNWDRRLSRVLEELGLVGLLDAMFISEELGFAKPDWRIFDQVRRRMCAFGLPIWHIGDAYKEDFQGARRAGFWPILFDPQGTRPWVRPRVVSLYEAIWFIEGSISRAMAA